MQRFVCHVNWHVLESDMLYYMYCALLFWLSLALPFEVPSPSPPHLFTKMMAVTASGSDLSLDWPGPGRPRIQPAVGRAKQQPCTGRLSAVVPG